MLELFKLWILRFFLVVVFCEPFDSWVGDVDFLVDFALVLIGVDEVVE